MTVDQLRTALTALQTKSDTEVYIEDEDGVEKKLTSVKIDHQNNDNVVLFNDSQESE